LSEICYYVQGVTDRQRTSDDVAAARAAPTRKQTAGWTTEPIKTKSGALVLESLAKQDSNLEISALAKWIKGISALTKGKPETAIKRLDEAAAIFYQTNKEHEAAQTQVSKLYALALLGNYNEAIKIGKKILKIFEKVGDELAAGKIEKNIGNIFWRRDFYKKAENNFLSAQKRFTKIKNQEGLAMVENCLSTVCSADCLFRKRIITKPESISGERWN